MPVVLYFCERDNLPTLYPLTKTEKRPKETHKDILITCTPTTYSFVCKRRTRLRPSGLSTVPPVPSSYVPRPGRRAPRPLLRVRLLDPTGPVRPSSKRSIPLPHTSPGLPYSSAPCPNYKSNDPRVPLCLSDLTVVPVDGPVPSVWGCYRCVRDPSQGEPSRRWCPPRVY